jgi:hypothetical protein
LLAEERKTIISQKLRDLREVFQFLGIRGLIYKIEEAYLSCRLVIAKRDNLLRIGTW